ncbi:MAG: alpha/beta fold hydrolase [Micromonosporaceae bacterium]|nr:alpha/beta fold hydrolase [Micromonosporaceae bacterium]
MRPTDKDEPIVEYLQRGDDRLAVHIYPEPPDASGPFVVIWPAMGVPARYYRSFVVELRAAGLGVAVADLRGTGASTPPPSRRSRYRLADLVDDVAAVQQALAPRITGRRCLLLGHSLGGQVALLHTGLAEESTVDGVVLVAVGLPHFRRYPPRRAAWVLALTQGTNAASALLRVWPGWRFGGRQARGVIRDWAYTARHGRYPHLAGRDAEAALRGVAVPVLAISVENDAYTPEPTTELLVGKLAAARVEREHYSAAQAGAPLNHFRWVRASAPLAVRVAEFAARL